VDVVQLGLTIGSWAFCVKVKENTGDNSKGKLAQKQLILTLKAKLKPHSLKFPRQQNVIIHEIRKFGLMQNDRE